MRALLLIASGLVIAAVAAGCGGSVRATTVSVRGPLWCFAATVQDEAGRRAMGCFDRLALCAKARRTAERYGGMAGVREVGPCEYWAVFQ